MAGFYQLACGVEECGLRNALAIHGHGRVAAARHHKKKGSARARLLLRYGWIGGAFPRRVCMLHYVIEPRPSVGWLSRFKSTPPPMGKACVGRRRRRQENGGKVRGKQEHFTVLPGLDGCCSVAATDDDAVAVAASAGRTRSYGDFLCMLFFLSLAL